MKKNEGLFRYNLQFFAEDGEGTSETTQEVATPETSEGEVTTEEGTTEGETGSNEEPAAPQVQSEEANRAFASMRREAEAARKQLAEIDNAYARQYAGYKNPETGAPIRSAKDYIEAMAAQERMQAREKLRENNIDPDIVDRMIANSPVVRQAEAVTAELNNYRAQQMIEEDMKKVLAIDPTMTSKEDIYNDPSYASVVEYIGTHPGMRFDEAYKLVNFERLASSKTAAAKQAVVNQVKGQSHLSNAPGVTTNDGLEDIPASMLDDFKDMFPEKSMKELKALYNRTLKSRR
jgi:hypothetical protein